MYLILEGMPGTGKTTIAKRLSEILNYKYVKSVNSDTRFGELVKSVSGDENEAQKEILFLADSLLDEIRIASFIRNGDGVVRDKCPAASMGHLNAHGYINTDKRISSSIAAGYKQVKEYAVMPDLVIHFYADQEAICNHLAGKKDISAIDMDLLCDMEMYRKQDEEIYKALMALYDTSVIRMRSFSASVEDMCNDIIFRLGAMNHG